MLVSLCARLRCICRTLYAAAAQRRTTIAAPTQIRAIVLGDNVADGTDAAVAVVVIVAAVREMAAVEVRLGGGTERVVDEVEERVDAWVSLSSHPSFEHGSKGQQPRKLFCAHV